MDRETAINNIEKKCPDLKVSSIIEEDDMFIAQTIRKDGQQILGGTKGVLKDDGEVIEVNPLEHKGLVEKLMNPDEVIRLYDLEYDKPELNDDLLMHFGILGMKWGVRKDRGKKGMSKRKARKLRKRRIKTLKRARKARAKQRKEQQEVQKTKEDIIKTKDISNMLKNVDKFSNQEINDMLTRLDTEQKLRDRVAKEAEARMPKGKRMLKKAKEDVGKGISSGASSLLKTVSENAVKVGVRELAKQASLGDEETEKIIDQLFKEKKK